ncbi:gp22 [Listeria phage P40]|uniref:gp22 n=1 Tax=Listeria phage P40 TaxID=560178 RepID=UPI00018198DC|nr:gp22 [Listeria phage P40]ACI00382.1 gp22 [Listeria phage P40]
MKILIIRMERSKMENKIKKAIKKVNAPLFKGLDIEEQELIVNQVKIKTKGKALIMFLLLGIGLELYLKGFGAFFKAFLISCATLSIYAWIYTIKNLFVGRKYVDKVNSELLEAKASEYLLMKKAVK